MYHDEPSHRPGQDPYAYAEETEEHYGVTLRDYQEKVRRLAPDLPNAAIVRALYETEIARYQGYLDNLIERKRAEGLPIHFDYATAEDMVFREDAAPWMQEGKTYSKCDVMALARNSVDVAKLLLEHANRRGARVLKDAHLEYGATVMVAAQAHANEHFLADGLRTAFINDMAKLIGVESLVSAVKAVVPKPPRGEMGLEP